MPFESERQRRFMYAAAEGKVKGKDAPSPEQARSFIEHSGGHVKRKFKGRHKRRKRD